MNQSRDRRAERSYFVGVDYSALDLLIPSKLGAIAAYQMNADAAWELEYLKGSVAVPFLIKDFGLSDLRHS